MTIGGLVHGSDNAEIHSFVLSTSQSKKPNVCYVPLASGDYDLYVELFYQQYPTTVCQPSHLNLLRTVDKNPETHLAEQDIVYLGGGSTPVLLAGLQILGLDQMLSDVLARGGVIAGDSAGAHVMFGGSITDSLGDGLQVFGKGLGFLEGSCAAHADDIRRQMLAAALSASQLSGPAWAIGDGAVAAFSGSGLVAATATDDGSVTRLYHDPDSGLVRSTNLEVVRLNERSAAVGSE